MSEFAANLPGDFLHAYWERQVFSGRTAPLDAWTLEPASAFLARYGEPVRVFVPGTMQERRSVEPAQALEMLAHGATLYLVNYHLYDARCQAVLETFNRLIGPARGRVSVFLSNGRSYMPFHWDKLNNFTFQLAGRKTWLLAPNHLVPLPLENFAAGRGQGRDRLRPDRRQVSRIVMDPGSLIYVPRGHWHATRTQIESISLSINFEPDVLVDSILERLRSELITSVAFRQNLQGLPIGAARALVEDGLRAARLALSHPQDVERTPPPSVTDSLRRRC